MGDDGRSGVNMGDEAIRNSSVSTGDDRDFLNFGVSFGDDAIRDSCTSEFWKIGVSMGDEDIRYSFFDRDFSNFGVSMGDDCLRDSCLDRDFSNSRVGDSAISESLRGGSPKSKEEPIPEEVLLAMPYRGRSSNAGVIYFCRTKGPREYLSRLISIFLPSGRS